MLELLKNLKRPKYEPFNSIEIIKENLIDNFNYIQNIQPQAEIIPVLKSNAYGHGIKEIARILAPTKAKMLAVDSFPEAQIVYRYSRKKVLILGEMPLGVYRYCDFKRTEFCVYNLETFRYLATLNKKAKIHLFLNTGMNREGIQDLEKFLSEAGDDLKKVEINGLCSHFASADDESLLNKNQEEKFLENLEFLKSKGINPKYTHLGNSAGIFILNNPKFTAFRAGIALYGYNIFQENHKAFQVAKKLKPALRLYSKIIAVQKIKAGEKVSYNETFTANAETVIASIPFGYYEGLDRRMSNTAKFLVRTKHKSFYATVAGRVCMNLTVLNCENNEIKIGDTVKIISENPQEVNSIENLAKSMYTVPYEFLVKLQSNIRRIIVES